MKSTFKLLAKLPFYFSFRNIGMPLMLPFNYTFSMTPRCNSRCKTCNIWKFQRKIKNELSTDEWIKIIKSLGKSPFWITMGGGEPFLRDDLTEIVSCVEHINEPNMITIPTNGLLKVEEKIRKILEVMDNETKLIINFSIDAIDKDHDYIRGVPNNWKRTLESYRQTKKLKVRHPNLIVGINTVISRWNVKKIEEINRYLINKLRPDHYVTEISEVRNEMRNSLNRPTPSPKDYERAINFLIDEIGHGRFHGTEKLTQAFRLEYYEYVRNFHLRKIKCLKSYAGFTSAHISSTGDVWECAIYASNMGNLRDFDFDFGRLWKSNEANRIRDRIRKSHECVLANEFYSSAIFDPGRAIKIVKRLV